MKEKKDLIKYHNDINNLRLGKFTDKETDIFFSILFKSMGTIGNVVINFNELKDLIEGNRSEERLINSVRRLNLKLKKLVGEVRDIEGNYTAFSLFGDITTRPKERDIIVRVDDRFRNLIDNLVGNFTIFDLKDLISLNSTYSKILFRLLKQWETKKERIFEIEEFREILSIPEKYRISEIDKFVLKPAMEDLVRFFPYLRLEKIKNKRSVSHLKFIWYSQIPAVASDEDDEEEEIEEIKQEEIEFSEELYNLIMEMKGKVNFNTVLTPQNIRKLAEKYEENMLIRILRRTKNNSFEKIKSIKYFDKVYRDIVAEPKITMRKNEKNSEIKTDNSDYGQRNLFENIEENGAKSLLEIFKEYTKPIEKEKISAEEAEKRYQEYLKQIGEKHRETRKINFMKEFEIIETTTIEVKEDTSEYLLEEKHLDKKIFTEQDIPEERFLNKNGKKLVGSALNMRIRSELKKLNNN